VLASNRRAVVEEATYNPLICYEIFLWTKKQPAILICVVERSSRLPYSKQGLGLIQSGIIRPALKGAPIDVIYHSKFGNQHTMIEVMNHIKVLLKSTGGSEYSCSQYNKCVTTLMTILPGEIMCRVLADRSDKAPATTGIEAWKYYQYVPYQGYNHVPNIALSVNGLSVSQFTTIFRDMAHRNFSMCLLLRVSMSQYRRTTEKNNCCWLSSVSTIIATSATMLSKTRTEIFFPISGCADPWDT
jgi:hypothetical protein